MFLSLQTYILRVLELLHTNKISCFLIGGIMIKSAEGTSFCYSFTSEIKCLIHVHMCQQKTWLMMCNGGHSIFSVIIERKQLHGFLLLTIMLPSCVIIACERVVQRLVNTLSCRAVQQGFVQEYGNIESMPEMMG